MKIRMSDYKDAFKGSTALVLGGGPSLPEDLRKAPLSDHPIIIAVNYHALKLIEADFIVYNDEPKTDPELLGAVMKFKGVRVSPDPRDVVLFFRGPFQSLCHSCHAKKTAAEINSSARGGGA